MSAVTHSEDEAYSLRHLAQESLDVQNACNLVAVVASFARALRDLRNALREAGEPCDSKAIEQHPITIMWSNKIASLTCSDDTLLFSKSYNAVNDLAEGK